jgi:hypothetical protein
VDWSKLFQGVKKASVRREQAPLAQDVAAALRQSALPAFLLLAKDDATAVAAEAELAADDFAGLIAGREVLETDSHTFARPGDEAMLLGAVERALAAVAVQAV